MTRKAWLSERKVRQVACSALVLEDRHGESTLNGSAAVDCG